MKSFCIKTNNVQVQKFLLNKLSCIDFDDVYYINRQFKIYNNIIIHYKGCNINSFLVILSDLIADCILLNYEPILIRRSINLNYFYFDEFEKKMIEETCFSHITSDEDKTLKFRKKEISQEVLHYVSDNKYMILDGFVDFRLDNYNKTLDEVVDYSVNKYVIEKEYNEFISLLRLYIDSKDPSVDLVHLVYTSGESILLDKSRNIISLSDDIFNTKYLSDISFSSNDYALNALLTLLPKKVEVHIIGYEDEFINTLKLIFDSRISICNDCNICRTYRVLNNTNNM